MSIGAAWGIHKPAAAEHVPQDAAEFTATPAAAEAAGAEDVRTCAEAAASEALADADQGE